MTVLSLAELANMGDDSSLTKLESLRQRLGEVALRAGLAGESGVEKLAKDVAQEINEMAEEQERTIADLENEIAEMEVRRDEIEDAIAEKYDYSTAVEIMEAARATGKERRKKERATAAKLSA